HRDLHSFPTRRSSDLTGIANPSEAGNFAVAHFTYGSGTDRHRQEFRSGVRYRTQPVDATPILHAWEGSAAKWREKFWGFDAKARSEEHTSELQSRENL